MISQQRDLEETARSARRARILAQGGAGDYADPETFAAVDSVLRRVLDGSRKPPPGLSMVAFLAGVMRSIKAE